MYTYNKSKFQRSSTVAFDIPSTLPVYYLLTIVVFTLPFSALLPVVRAVRQNSCSCTAWPDFPPSPAQQISSSSSSPLPTRHSHDVYYYAIQWLNLCSLCCVSGCVRISSRLLAASGLSWTLLRFQSASVNWNRPIPSPHPWMLISEWVSEQFLNSTSAQYRLYSAILKHK